MEFVNIIFGIIGLLIFGGVAYYLYTRNDKGDFVYNDEYRTVVRTKENSLILFYVTWCPYSQDALKTWNIIKNKYNNEKHLIIFSEIDCDKESELANTYNIKEYPTIILVKDGKNYEYDANLSEDSLHLFINTVMGK
jgi:thioredoxin-like negative regulator of GroEL